MIEEKIDVPTKRKQLFVGSLVLVGTPKKCKI